jgi:conjugative relaxase-like TrwC/TraI family protein
MLRIIQSQGAGHAKRYFSTADYYTEGQELTGRWRGEAARRLGLDGNIKQSDWDALCDNINPGTGQRLTARTRGDRTVGYDFNFHVPKSLSLLYAVTRDERIVEAFRESVQATMEDMECEMLARVRKGGKNEDRLTGNLVWGEFIHFTARPVDGVPDPHLHAHCFVQNVTYSEEEQAWKAGQFRELMRDAPYFEALFHSRLAHRLSDLGLPIERTKHCWELSGVDKSLLKRFSRRTAEIEERAKELAVDNPDAKAELGAKTRSRKQKQLSMPELEAVWRTRMTPAEIQNLEILAVRLGGEAESSDPSAAGRAVEFAIDHQFERQSVVPQRSLITTALKRGYGQASPDQVFDAIRQSELISGSRNGRTVVTTRSVLDEETRMVGFARDGRGTCPPFVSGEISFQRDWLNDQQKRAVETLLHSRDRVMVLRGLAGVGKTTLMQETVEAIEGAGKRVFAFAPSADASRGVLREAGFKDADTVARLLVDDKLQAQMRGQVLWIDEAGLLGTKTLADVFDLAARNDYRVLLTGDRAQHGSVERGSALRLLEEEAGIVPAEVKEIKRQTGQYKEAVKALAEGRVGEAFARLDRLGWICEVSDAERYRLMAADYVASVEAGKRALVVSPTHIEGDRITGAIRSSLAAKDLLGQDEREVTSLVPAHLTEAERSDGVNYLPGDVLVYHQNARGRTRGDRVTVANPTELPFHDARRFQVYHTRKLALAAGDLIRVTRNGKTLDGKHRLNNGAVYQIRRFDAQGNLVLDNGWTVSKSFGHLTHGYVATSHASQGKNFARVIIGQSSLSLPASSREQAYVSVSRGKQRATIYTDNKRELLAAVSQADERVSATELMQSLSFRVADSEQQRQLERAREEQRRRFDQERHYERQCSR